MRSAFSTIIVHVILFIAAAVIAYLFVSSVYNSLYDIQGAMLENQKNTADRIRTIFDIDSCAYDNVTYTLSLYLTNRGSVTIPTDNINLFIDGIYTPISNVTFVKNINYDSGWDKYEVIEINATKTLTGQHLVKVVVSNGASDEKTISISGASCTIV